VSIADRVRLENETLLSDDWYILKKTVFSFRRSDGTWQRQSRETYDRGNGAVILLYSPGSMLPGEYSRMTAPFPLS